MKEVIWSDWEPLGVQLWLSMSDSWIKSPTLDFGSGHDLGVMEGALHQAQCGVCWCLSISSSPARDISLSLSQINKQNIFLKSHLSLKGSPYSTGIHYSMLSGDFSMRIQSWDKPVPPAELSGDEGPFLGNWLFEVRHWTESYRVERMRTWLRQEILSVLQILQVWWVILRNHTAKEESSTSANEEMKDNWRKEKKDGDTQTDQAPTMLWFCRGLAGCHFYCQMELMEISELIYYQSLNSTGYCVCVMLASGSEKKLS